MSEEAHILELLRDRVEQARFRHERAKAAFWSIAADPRQLPRVPTGRLQPDGSDRIREAFREETEAKEALLEAVHRFNDFLLAQESAAEVAEVGCHQNWGIRKAGDMNRSPAT